MKTKNFIWLLFFGIMLCSCEKQPATNEPVGGNGGSGGDDEPEMRMSLVKFTDDAYREYILATAFSDNARMRATSPPVAEELILGTIPYSVKLPNGYWVIDWRWESGQIVQKLLTMVTLTKYTIKQVGIVLILAMKNKITNYQ